MPRKSDKINVVMHFPDEISQKMITEETNKFFAYAVKKYLDNLDFDEKKEAVKAIISQFR